MKGYKHTDIGNIPNEWEVKTLGEVGDVKMCKRIFSYQTDTIGEIPFYKIGTFGNEADAYITKELYNEFKTKFSFPKIGDILISASGTIGRTIVYDGIDAYFQDSNIVWIDNNEKIITNEYLYFVFQIVKYETEGSTIKRLYNSILKATRFVLPPLPEQQAIAQALSHTDALITNLQNLIAKKRLIKQGAMQELLTPKKDWEVKKLGEVCDVRKGQLITEETKTNGNIPVIAGGKKPSYYHNKPNRVGKTITISGSGANAGYVSFHNYPIFASDCSTISESKNYSIEFIYFFLQLIQEKIYKMQTGGAQPHIHPSDVNPIEFSIPKTIEEQTQIATILTDMDNEVNSLAQKLEKYKSIKQGMMQDLLTGKVRLV